MPIVTARFHPQVEYRFSSDDAETQLISLAGSELTLWGAVQAPLQLFLKTSRQTQNNWNNLGIFLPISLRKIRQAFSESALVPLKFRDSISTKWISYLDTSEVVLFISTERECWVFKVMYRYYVLWTSSQVDWRVRFIIVLRWTCQSRKRQAHGSRTPELGAQFLSLLLACWATSHTTLHQPLSSSSSFSPLV